MKDLLKRALPDALVIVAFLLVSFFYFATPMLDGLELTGHDTTAGIGLGQEQVAHHEATGERTRWTNSAFSGMPTYQIAPTYGPMEALQWVGRAVGLATPAPLSYLFLYLLGFYILMRAFRVRPLLSAFGAVAWAFSTYFLIIIAAGHLWKVSTLAFIPPTIAGLVLAYRGRTLWGLTITGLFTGLQVLNNHLQMTYYFLFPMAFIVVAYGVEAVRKGQMAQWAKATGAIVLGGLLGAAVNLSNLYHTWQYSKESMRGPSELTAKVKPADGKAATGALDRDYITAWSYGIDETLTLMIANFKGGGSQSILDRDDAQDLEGFDTFYQSAGQLQQMTGGGYLPGTSQYWGDQPMTVGPVYAGAIIVFLFVLGLFIVEGPIKWAMLAATLVSLLFAWGKNIMGLTDLFIDYLPMYAKFRTVSSALVVAELTLPLMAILALARIMADPAALLREPRKRLALGISLALTGGVCLLVALMPNITALLGENDLQMFAQLQTAGVPADFISAYRGAVSSMHADILSADAWRSCLLIACAALLLVFHAMRPKALHNWLVVGLLLVLTLGDLWNVNRRYLNNDNFAEPTARAEGLAPTAADERIATDKTRSYRVLNLGAGNPFNESTNQTSYRHQSIGGYHAAKLHRYQDLIDRYLLDECNNTLQALGKAQQALMADSLNLAAKGIRTADDLADRALLEAQTEVKTPMLNMLNARWMILGAGQAAVQNHEANGNGWFVRSLRLVDNADAEIDALRGLDTKTAAVADKRFAAQLEGSALDSGTVVLTHYAPNELHYKTQSGKGGLLVLSEIYYPGWTATIDGQPVELGRVNYVLRALKVPAGAHEIRLEFRPTSVATTDAIGYAALFALLALLALSGWMALRKSGVASTSEEGSQTT